MKPSFAVWDEPTFELALEGVTRGLDDRGVQALESRTQPDELEELELVAAAIMLGHIPVDSGPSASLLAEMEIVGRRHVAARSALEPSERDNSALIARAFSWAGWLAAAAVLLFFSLVSDENEITTSKRRADLIASTSDLVRLDWTGTEDLAATGVSGNVVWSEREQEGYMLFRGLVPNDPMESQFQLWIFDPTRADWESKPVDGGVFDVLSDGEVVVAIDAKLAVAETALFAVTIEAPGGVVVSERERLVLTASL